MAWAEIQDLRDGGQFLPARDLALTALSVAPHSIALAFQLSEVLLALEGPGSVMAWADSLDSAGEESISQVLRLTLADAFAKSPEVRERIAKLRPFVDSSGLDALVLSYCETPHLYPRGSPIPEPAFMDSLLEWSQLVSKNPQLAGTAHQWAHWAFQGLPALDLVSRGQTSEALHSLITVRDECSRRKLSTLELSQTLSIGLISVRSGMNQAAYPEYQRALKLARHLGDRYQESVALSFLGYLAENRRESQEALEFYSQASELSRQLGNLHGTGWALMGEGWVRWLNGDIAQAEETLSRGLDAFLEADNPLGQARALLNLGVLLVSTERPVQALAAYERGLAIAERLEHAAERSRFLNNIANLHYLNGHSERCLPYYIQALELAKASGNRQEIARILSNLSLVSATLDHRDQTLAYLEEAIKLTKDSGNPAQEAAYREQLAGMLIRFGSPEEARQHLDRAMDLAGKMDDWLLNGNIAETLGYYLEALEEWSGAITEFDKADTYFSERGHTSGRIRFLDNLAWAQAETGHLERAINTADIGETLSRMKGDGFQQAKYRGLKAHLQLRFGIPGSGWDECQDALAMTIEARLQSRALRSGSDGPGWFRPQAQGNYLLSLMLELSITDHRIDDPEFRLEAFSWLQKQKARSLLELLEPTSAYIQPSVPDRLMERLRSGRHSLEMLEKALERPESTAARDSFRLALANEQSSYDEILTQVLAKDPRFARAHRSSVLEASQVQDWINRNPGTLLLDYLMPSVHEFDSGMRAYLMAWDSSSLRIHPLQTVGELSRQIGFYLDLMSSGSNQGSGSGVYYATTAIFQALLGPEVEGIRLCNNLIICPDGPIHTVPFAALLNLGQEVPSIPPLTLTPSLSVLQSLVTRSESFRETPGRYDLGIWSSEGTDIGSVSPQANTLRFAAAERAALERTIPNHSVFPAPEPDQSARSALQNAGILGRCKILHFIAHGSFDDARPWAASLQLWPENDISARHRLATHDIYGLDFRTELVTLSACETARGNILVGEGMLGMAQAMFGAGALSVLATLWPVDDASTAVFMSRFYEQLGQGKTKSEALQFAQSSFLGEPSRAHPYYWAGYVLLGESSGRIEIRTMRPTIKTFLLIGVGLLLVGIAFRLR